MKVKVLSNWALSWFLLKRYLSNNRGALAFSVKNVISHGLGGIKIRLVTITLDTDYLTPGYTITPTNCNLHTKILYMSSAVIGIYAASPTLSGNNAILQMIVGAAGVNAEAADGLDGLTGQVGMFLVIGY